MYGTCTKMRSKKRSRHSISSGKQPCSYRVKDRVTIPLGGILTKGSRHRHKEEASLLGRRSTKVKITRSSAMPQNATCAPQKAEKKPGIQVRTVSGMFIKDMSMTEPSLLSLPKKDERNRNKIK